MDTKQLRQKILDLAIRGKLVPQDPNDEPASVLLERVKAEKERLIAEGKIKRSKKSATSSDKPHYPFEIPGSWEWIRLEEFVLAVTDGDHLPPPQAPSGIPFLVISDVNTGRISFDKARFVSEYYYKTLPDIRKAKEGDLLFTVTGSYGIVIPVDTNRKFCFQRHIGLIKTITSSPWIRFVLQSNYVQSYCDNIATGTAQKTVSLGHLRNLIIPIPPDKEQVRIINELEIWLNKVEIIQRNECDLKRLLSLAKSIILNLSIHGKLVPQDPADEPAVDLLKRVNPNAVVSTDTSHYQHLPQGWCVCKLEDIVEYEQPQRYIVESTDYSDAYKTPVLTAGKSFVIGHTNESAGVFDKVPVIIFDDFTTDSKYVDFPFKVKSSAMKILHVKSGVNIKYVYYFMSITRLVGKTHKRYWISEYSKLDFPLPPYNEQCRIVDAIERINNRIDDIAEAL